MGNIVSGVEEYLKVVMVRITTSEVVFAIEEMFKCEIW